MAKKRSKPLWKLEDGVTFSSLSSWLECREQFALKWIDGVTPKKISIALEFGSLIHHCLENQFAAQPKEVADRVCSHYYEYRLGSLKSTQDKNQLQLIVGLAKVLFPHYCNYWNSDDRRITWIGREEKFAVPYRTGDRDFLLRGMRDGVFEAPNTFGIFETKTMSRVVESDIDARLHADMQTLLYCFCTYLSEGRMPNAILFNVIRRPDIYRQKKESLDSYLDRVNSDISERPDHYFKRWNVWIGKHDIEIFVEKTLNPILGLFADWWDSIKKNPLPHPIVGEDGNEIPGRWSSPYHFRNYNALLGKYGKTEMWDAIFGKDYPYHIREEAFPELTDSFAVTWDKTTEKVV